MKGFVISTLALFLSVILSLSVSLAATEQFERRAIDDGLAALAVNQNADGSWPHPDFGTLATTAAAAFSFIEDERLPGTDVIIDDINYGDVVGRACDYIFDKARLADEDAYGEHHYTSEGDGGKETDTYTRYAEDYNSDGILNDGGNNQAIYFEPGISKRRVYTTGIVAPLIFALGEALGPDTEVGRGALTETMTYRQLMRDVIDWFSWGQVEPSKQETISGVTRYYRGGWRYDANYENSDNSTGMWPALAIIYGKDWGLQVPQYVRDELKLWTDYIQNDNGGSGYQNDLETVNVSKTAGLLLQFYVLGYQVGVDNNPLNDVGNEVNKALEFINSRWNDPASSSWYGNLLHPYAMWAVYKALGLYGFLIDYGSADPSEDFLIGLGMPSAPGGIEIGQDYWEGPPDVPNNISGVQSLPEDWYSHYCDVLVESQNREDETDKLYGSWNGYGDFKTALATSWYINILNAPAGIPPSRTLAVDIMPGKCPNEFKCNSSLQSTKGTLVIAICGVSQNGNLPFNVRDIDPATIRLTREGNTWELQPTAHEYQDLATPLFDGATCDCMDIGGDGIEDLVLEFDSGALAQQLQECGSEEPVSIPLKIVANTLSDGRLLSGEDCIKISPCGCACDLNCDGICDEKDLVIFSISLGWDSPQSNMCNEPGVVCECDLDHNGFCDAEDGVIFTEAYEKPQCYYRICDCNLVPENTQLRRGDTLSFDAYVTNMTGQSGTVKFGTKVTKPNGSQTNYYIWGPIDVDLTPNKTVPGFKSHVIPPGYPLGTSIYQGYVGLGGKGIIAECEFEFEVSESCSSSVCTDSSNEITVEGGEDDLVLSWDPITDTDFCFFRVFMREEDQDYDYGAPLWQGTETSFTASNLASGSTYYFVVTTCYINDDAETPSPPTNLRIIIAP